MNEKILTKKSKNMDNKVFEAIYKKYHRFVESYVISKIGNDNNVEDLVQEIFIRVYKHLKNYDENKGTFNNFILMNANNVIISYARKRRVRKNTSNDYDMETIEDDDFNIEEISERNEEKNSLSSIINDLPDTYKQAIDLVFVKNYSYKRAANIMGKSEASFKSILYRARKELRKKMFEKYPEMRTSAIKHGLKIILILVTSICLLGGLVYATIKIYKNLFEDKYTISEMREDVPEDFALVSRGDATSKINEYLSILGHDENVSADDLHLIRDYQLKKICWKAESEKYIIQIDAQSNDLIVYTDFDLPNSKINIEKLPELYLKLNFPNDYEKSGEQQNSNYTLIEMSKRYGNLYNEFESIKFSFIDDKLNSIYVSSYKYYDKEVLITEDDARKIFKENGIDAEDIYITIEEVNDFSYNNKINLNEEINEYNFNSNEIENRELDIRKVWKTEVNNKLYFVWWI